MLYPEKTAAQKVQEEPGLRSASRRFPVIAQLVAGRLDRVEATAPHVSAGRVSVAKVEGTVDDLRIVGNLPNSVKGAVLSALRGEVFLAFDDLDREAGTSQVQLTPGRQKNTVRAYGELPMAGTQAEIRARSAWGAREPAACP
ncbi:LmeA family phospholipid-binding protein [Streptomyces xiaopingdaonensis]|uniref:LmeA family phospholipid-binding protein n=1 Tax=Streptomyces xiaopingdaonensis TaxID=1565415 RepID=UPI0004945D04|nr:LmeA family phospholipid-binding protein [Streptomyces xiaopingdaonensis]